MTKEERLIELVKDITENPTTPENDTKYLTDNGVTIPVRCEECKHNSRKVVFCWNYIHCERYGTIFNKNYFCSYGERRTDT